MTPRLSFTERLARASAARPRRVLALWGAALVLSFVVIASLLPSALTSEARFTRDIESKRADDLLAERLPAEQASVETLVVRSDTRLSADDPASRRRSPTSAARSPRSARTSSPARRRPPRRPPTATPSP